MLIKNYKKKITLLFLEGDAPCSNANDVIISHLI